MYLVGGWGGGLQSGVMWEGPKVEIVFGCRVYEYYVRVLRTSYCTQHTELISATYSTDGVLYRTRSTRTYVGTYRTCARTRKVVGYLR